jgi:hypothetical protein
MNLTERLMLAGFTTADYHRTVKPLTRLQLVTLKK